MIMDWDSGSSWMNKYSLDDGGWRGDGRVAREVLAGEVAAWPSTNAAGTAFLTLGLITSETRSPAPEVT